MPPNPERSPQEIKQELVEQIDIGKARWFLSENQTQDQQEYMPKVGFCYEDGTVVAVLVAGFYKLDEETDNAHVHMVDGQPKATVLIYTVGEWEAFIGGVKDREFDDFAKGSEDVGVRDSKDPNGPILVFPADMYRAYLDIIKDGGYDLTAVPADLEA